MQSVKNTGLPEYVIYNLLKTLNIYYVITKFWQNRLLQISKYSEKSKKDELSYDYHTSCFASFVVAQHR